MGSKEWQKAPQGFSTLDLQLVVSGSNLIVDNLDDVWEWTDALYEDGDEK